MNQHEANARKAARYVENHVRVFLEAPGREMSPAEREWWHRLAGNLAKAQIDNPHLGRKHHGR